MSNVWVVSALFNVRHKDIAQTSVLEEVAAVTRDPDNIQQLVDGLLADYDSDPGFCGFSAIEYEPDTLYQDHYNVRQFNKEGQRINE